MADLVVAKQPTTALHLRVGQKVVFSVLGNASTGASWTVKDAGTPGLKFLANAPIAQKQTNPPVVGRGATYLISFKAVKKGTFHITLLYGRSWEMAKGAKPWDKRTADVVVR